jgi:hypothetical protein
MQMRNMNTPGPSGPGATTTTRIANRGELSLQAYADEVAAQRARAQRPEKSRQRRLRAAVEQAHLPDRAFTVFVAGLLPFANSNGKISNQNQPSFRELQRRLNGMSWSTLARSLEHLERHGWVTRVTDGKKKTRYALYVGVVCDCRPGRGQRMTGAERVRKHRAMARWRETLAEDIAAVSNERYTNREGTVSNERYNHVSNERYTNRGDVTPVSVTNPRSNPEFPLIRTDLHQEQVLTPTGPVQDSTTFTGENHNQTSASAPAVTPLPAVAAKGLTRCAANFRETHPEVHHASPDDGPPAQQIPDEVLHGDQPDRSVRTLPRRLSDRSEDGEWIWPELAPDNPWANVNMTGTGGKTP